MAGFLGALEYVLEEGPRNDWFGDDTVLLMAWVSGLSAVVFFARVLTAKQPIVDLRAFADRNFGLGSLFSFVLGIGLYGLTYLYPLYLAQIRGYNALMIGETMFVSGVAMFLTAPDRRPADDQGRPALHADGRLPVSSPSAPGWMTYLTKDWDFWELFWPQVFRGVGLMMAIDPDQQHRARHAAARAREERLGPLSISCAISAARSGSRRSPRSSTTAPTCTWRACTRPSPGRVSRRWRRSTT